MKKIFALTLGLLLIASNCFATLLTYSTISSDAGVTTTALNDRFSEIKTFANGNVASINILDASIASEDIAVAANPLKRDGENIGEYVYTGGTIATSASLSSAITAMTAYIANDADGYLHRVSTAATNKTFTASKDTWVYCDYAGAFVYSEVANGAGQPSTPSNSIILAKVVTDGTTVSSVTDQRQTTPQNLRIYNNYIQGAVISRDISTANKISIDVGEIEFGSSNGKVRRNTTPVYVTLSTTGRGGLDTGSQAASTFYYIYALADDDNATNWESIASTSKTDASGVTGERLIGWVYSASTSVLSTDSIGAYRGLGGNAPNVVQRRGQTNITSGSTSMTNMPDMDAKFYSSGRPIIISFNAPFYIDDSGLWVNIQVDGISKDIAYIRDEANASASAGSHQLTVNWMGRISEGEHTIQVGWQQDSVNAVSQRGLTDGSRVLIIQEL